MMVQEPNHLRKQQILIIDPSESARHRLKLYFEQQGNVVYTVGYVEKIKQVIEGIAFSGVKLDMILVDVRLPGCFAFYALKKIQEALNQRKVPIFIMSFGFSRFAIRQMARWNVLGYIRKPFKVEFLDEFLVERLKFFEKITQSNENKDELVNEAGTKSRAA